MIFIVIFLLIMILVLFISVSTGGYPENMTAQKLYTKIEKMESFFKQEKIQKYFENLEIPVKTLYTLDEIPDKLSYSATWFLTPRREHIGQLKLFLSELQFLTTVISDRLQKFIVIYSGSAPSNKIAFMENFYPNIRWILIDPNEHVIMYPNKTTQYDEPHSSKFLYLKAGRGNGKVYPYYAPDKRIEKSEFNNDYFTTDLNADEISDLFLHESKKYLIIEDYMSDDLGSFIKQIVKKCLDKHIYSYFISDIRTNSEGEAPSDLDVLWNSAQQMSWCKIIRPEKAMLKFRTPFWDTSESVKRDADKPMYDSVLKKAAKYCDFISDYNLGKFKYFKADVINLQAFAGKSSTETRLITGNFDDLVEYNYQDFEDKLFYYNKIYCDVYFHKEHEKYLDKEHGIDSCGDCSIMCGIFKAYFDKYNLPDKVSESVSGLMKQINRGFTEKGSYHGVFYKPYKNIQDIVYFQKRLQSIILYRTIKLNFRKNDLTPRNIFIAKRIEQIHVELQDKKIPILDKIRFHMDLQSIFLLIPFFKPNDFIAIASSILFASDKSKQVVIEVLDSIISAVNSKHVKSYPKIEWENVYTSLRRSKGIEIHKNAILEFIKEKKIQTVYEINGFKITSVMEKFPGHKLGLVYDYNNKSDFYAMDLKNISDNSLVFINIHGIPDYMVLWFIDHIKYKSSIVVILVVYRRLYGVEMHKNFMHHLNIITKHKDVVSSDIPSTTSKISFYTQNISDSQLRSIVEFPASKNHRY